MGTGALQLEREFTSTAALESETEMADNCTVHHHALAIARGVAAAFASSLTTVAVVYIVLRHAYTTILQRLVLALTLFTALHLLAMTMQIHPGSSGFCRVTGFLVQYTSSVGVVLIAGTVLYLWHVVRRAGSKHKKQFHGPQKPPRRKKTEMLFYLFSVVFPLTYNWLPFLYGHYGKAGAWCWISATGPNCSHSHAGLLDQILLGYFPVMLTALLTSSLVAALACRYCRWARRFQEQRRLFLTEAAEVSLLLLYLVCYAIFSIAELVFGIAAKGGTIHNYGLLMTYALSKPLLRALVPLSFLLYIYSTREMANRLLGWFPWLHLPSTHCEQAVGRGEEDDTSGEEKAALLGSRPTQSRPGGGMRDYSLIQPTEGKYDDNPLYSGVTDKPMPT